MWNGIKALTDYKNTNLLPDGDATLPDALNQFFACFDIHREDAAPLFTPADNEPALVLKQHQVRTVLRGGHARQLAQMECLGGF